MGGDRAPETIVAGAIEAAELHGAELQVVLVGDVKEIEKFLPSERAKSLDIEIVHATESIGMDESAPSAYRKKRDASIVVASRLVRERTVDALVSAGNTGGVVTASLLELGRVKGVLRPAIASLVPTPSGHCILLDVGANSDNKPVHLYQFAVMGSVYAQSVFGVQNPKVGLLNIGEESSKGSDLAQQAFKIMAEGDGGLNFMGNVEGRDILKGAADIVVCDGFTGNIILKFAESVIGMVVGTIKREFTRNLKFRLAAFLLKPAFARVKSQLNYEEYGGAPLLGVNGIVVISHGSSSAKAIRNAVRLAARTAKEGVVSKIGEEISRELDGEEATG